MSEMNKKLSILSERDLQELLRIYSESDTPEAVDMLLQISEELANRERTEASAAEAEAAYEKFAATWLRDDMEADVELFPTEESAQPKIEPVPTKKKRRTRLRKTLIVIAAVICVLSALLLGTTAFNVNPSNTERKIENGGLSFLVGQNLSATMMNQCLEKGVEKSLVPTYRPLQYEFVDVDVSELADVKRIVLQFSVIAKRKGEPRTTAFYTIDLYPTADKAPNIAAQMEDEGAEVTEICSVPVYTFPDGEWWNATWADGPYVISVTGATSQEEIFDILNSVERINPTN